MTKVLNIKASVRYDEFLECAAIFYYDDHSLVCYTSKDGHSEASVQFMYSLPPLDDITANRVLESYNKDCEGFQLVLAKRLRK